MTDENGRPVTEREWKASLDWHNREHVLEEKHREQIANILREYREEAKDANDERLEHLNGFQRQFDKALGTFLTTDGYNREHGALVDRVNKIENKQSNWDGRMAAYTVIGALVASGFTSLIVYALTHS